MKDELKEVMGRWIDVQEALPEDDQRVLVICRTKKGVQSVNLAYYWNGTWHGQGSMAGVTHWMPLPPPPEVEAPQRNRTENETTDGYAGITRRDDNGRTEN